MQWLRSWPALLVLAALAFLAFLERMILDWRYVYSEFIPRDDASTTLTAILVYLVFAAAWIWALIALGRQQRSGAVALLGLSVVLLVGLGVATPLAFCPAPCDWAPLTEASNWAGLAVGALAAVGAGARLAVRA